VRDVQNQAAEVALTAQRESGKVTSAIESAQGARTAINSPYDAEKLPKSDVLSDAGISTQEASRWEPVAKLATSRRREVLSVTHHRRVADMVTQ
jgi:hypothetical protein